MKTRKCDSVHDTNQMGCVRQCCVSHKYLLFKSSNLASIKRCISILESPDRANGVYRSLVVAGSGKTDRENTVHRCVPELRRGRMHACSIVLQDHRRNCDQQIVHNQRAQ